MNPESVIIFIPTYKRPHLLKKAIKSALNQEWENLKVIVSDNASDDDTEEVVLGFSAKDARVIYYKQPNNLGMLGNYKFCVSIVDSDYFSFLSDDDFLLPSFCKTAVEEFRKHPAAAFVACATAIVDTDGRLMRDPISFWDREGVFDPPDGMLEMIGKYPVPNTVLFNTKFALNAQIDFENPVAWDCDFLLQVAGKYPVVIRKELCGLFLSHKQSFTRRISMRQLYDSVLKIKNRSSLFCGNLDAVLKIMGQKIDSELNNHALSLIINLLSERKPKEAKDCLLLYRDAEKRNLRYAIIRWYVDLCCFNSGFCALISALLTARRFVKKRRSVKMNLSSIQDAI